MTVIQSVERLLFQVSIVRRGFLMPPLESSRVLIVGFRRIEVVRPLVAMRLACRLFSWAFFCPFGGKVLELCRISHRARLA